MGGWPCNCPDIIAFINFIQTSGSIDCFIAWDISAAGWDAGLASSAAHNIDGAADSRKATIQYLNELNIMILRVKYCKSG